MTESQTPARHELSEPPSDPFVQPEPPSVSMRTILWHLGRAETAQDVEDTCKLALAQGYTLECVQGLRAAALERLEVARG